ncbi:serine/threonine protein kinase [Roseateles amylovorans]|uniref:Serine/threonine protein kinase n=1 Tax=Roseateles amylovorans TaxID=2978473 RepID=A0ABY6B0K4_9BURK|nr:serine/threonine-protein kinase [Roseateles amylovorans]UXH78732.1 serine/threonine protein kinase [Roseateles amylovorans]
MDALDKQRWIALSPLLDELLDLDEPARQRRLDEIRATDPSSAEHLEALLVRDAALSAQGFLEQPAAEQLHGAPDAPPLSVQSPDLSGETLGPYVLERELGQGGMGAVWLARRADGRFEGEVAVKFLKSGLFGRGDSGRFAREGQILARLSHPHIARLLDAGLHHGHQPYLVLEYVDGLPIDRFCHVHGLDIESRVRLFLDVLSAVAHAHQRLILHRDLKPSNILVTTAGEVKLLDFGIAKLLDDSTQPAAATELTQLAGSAFTPQYAAPEQVQQGDVTTATDVYALGVLLYQLLGGRHPTADDTQTHLDRLKAVVDLVPKRLSEVASGQLDPVIARQSRLLRGDLDTVLAKALKKAPAERYANAEQFAADLRHWLAHEPISARPDSRLYVLSRFVRRHRWSVAAGTAAVLALVGLTTISVLQAHRAAEAEHQAQQRRQQADDLLSYMLGEFADKLRPVGRLELLDSVGSKALTYLAQDEQATPQERLQRAKALTVIGEVRVSKGDLEGALEPLASAQRLLEGSAPSNGLLAEWRKSQGAAAFWVGHVHYTKRDLAKARPAMELYRSASESWLAADPGNVEALTELSYAENSLGTVLLDSSDLISATQRFRASIDLKKQLLARAPQQANSALRAELADSMSWLGTALLWQGYAVPARSIFSEGVELIAQVRKTAPKDGVWAYREVLLRRWIAEANFQAGDKASALDQLDLSLGMLRTLLSQDPANTAWRFNLLTLETMDLNARRDTMPTPLREQRLHALILQLDEMDRVGGASGRDRRVEYRARLNQLIAQDLMKTSSPEALQLLSTSAETVLSALKGRETDLRLLTALAEIQSLRIRAMQNAGESALRRQKVCAEVVQFFGNLNPLIRVHQQITSTWIDAQSCMGQGEDKEVQRAVKWLARNRSSV